MKDKNDTTMQRIVIIGTSGSGKSTYAKWVAEQLAVQHIESDSYLFGPNWSMQENAHEELEHATESTCWIFDGNYPPFRDIALQKATIVIWLDYPTLLVAWRLIGRTLKRVIFKQKLWNGNVESWLHQPQNFKMYFLEVMQHRRRRLENMLLPLQHPIQLVRCCSDQEARQWLQAYTQNS